MIPLFNGMRLFSFVIFTIVLTILSLSAFAGQASLQRGRGDLSLVVEETALYGNTDNEKILFSVPADDMTISMVGGRLGFEGVTPNGLGFKLTGGYQRMFFTSIGLEEIRKNLIAFDLYLSYYFRKTPKKCDPYITAGPSLLISSLNQQVYASAGVGSRFFLNDLWSFKIETTAMSDMSGIFGRLTFGMGYHF